MYIKNNLFVLTSLSIATIILCILLKFNLSFTTSSKSIISLIGKSEKNYQKRFPNVICIGSQKCGTGALQLFLNSHSQIHESKVDEPHFFDKYFEKGPEYYRNLMPKTLSSSTIFEKTPKYFVSTKVTKRLKNFYNGSNPKLILLLCNPVNRLFSAYTMIKKMPHLYIYKELKKFSSFKDYVDTSLQVLYSEMRSHSVNGQVFSENFIKFVEDFKYDSPHFFIKPFLNGIYAVHLNRWLKYFNKKEILILDGEKLLTKPWEILEKVQTYLDINQELTKTSFQYLEDKKFYCIKTSNDKSTCSSKGSTRRVQSNGKSVSKVSEDIAQKLEEFYSPFNKELREMVGESFSWM